MNYSEARRKALIKKIIGTLIVVPAFISTAVSLLKMLYFRLDDGTAMGSAIAAPFQRLVYSIYLKTNSAEWFWQHAPVPNLKVLVDSQNIYFFAIYLSIFIGFAIFSSGAKLSAKCREIDEEIEQQLIRESIRGERKRTKSQFQENVQIPSSSLFSQVHQLYLAPVITTILGGAFLKFMGM